MPGAKFNFCSANNGLFSVQAYGITELQTTRRGTSFCNHSVAIITDKGLSAFPLKELNSAVKCLLA